MAFVLNKERIAERLVNSYPDAIVYDERFILDFEETVSNFAERVVDSMSIYQMSMIFGRYFNTVKDCEDFLLSNIDTIYEYCDAYLDKMRK